MAKIPKRTLKLGIFPLVADLQSAINRFIEESNRNLRPFIWTANLTDVIAAVN